MISCIVAKNEDPTSEKHRCSVNQQKGETILNEVKRPKKPLIVFYTTVS